MSKLRCKGILNDAETELKLPVQFRISCRLRNVYEKRKREQLNGAK